MEDLRTIKEWKKEYNVIIYDPDGFDRSNPNLFNELFTREQFESGMYMSTCMFSVDHTFVNSEDN